MGIWQDAVDRRRRSGPTCVSQAAPAISRVLMQPAWWDAVVLRHRQTLAEVAEQISLGGHPPMLRAWICLLLPRRARWIGGGDRKAE